MNYLLNWLIEACSDLRLELFLNHPIEFSNGKKYIVAMFLPYNSLGSSVYAASEDIFPPIKATTGQPALGEEPLTMEGPVEWKEFFPQNGGASTKTTQPKSQPPSSKPPVMPAPSASTSSTGSGTGEIY